MQVGADVSDWKAGDDIMISPTGWYGATITDFRTLTANASASSLVLNAGISSRRFGQLQYAIDAPYGSNGLSLTPGTLTRPAYITQEVWDTIPKTVSERATIANLSRNIKIQAPQDAAWTTDNWGVSCQVQQNPDGTQGEARLYGVQIRMAGQQGLVERYPFEWHHLSYAMPNGNFQESSGVFLGDVTNQYMRKSVVHDASQRGLTIHGTCGLLIEDNVFFNVGGQCIFLEDGSEMRNIIRRNVVGRVRGVSTAIHPMTGLSKRIREFDDPQSAGGFGGGAGIWLSNPNNTVEGNIIFDTEGPGIWNAFAVERSDKPGYGCFGLSNNVQIIPSLMPLLLNKNNEAFCARNVPMMTEFGLTSSAGVVGPTTYTPRVGGLKTGAEIPFKIEGAKLWGGRRGGYRNRVGVDAIYEGWTVSSNNQQQIFGAAADGGEARRQLRVGRSLNPDLLAKPPDLGDDLMPYDIRTGIASYNSKLVSVDSLVVNFPHETPVNMDQTQPGFAGAFRYAGGDMTVWDTYIHSVEVGSEINLRNHYINSIPRWLAPARWMESEFPAEYGGRALGDTSVSPNFYVWNIAPARVNSYEQLGPLGWSWTYDKPFFTYGISAPNKQLAYPAGVNGVLTNQKMFGVDLLGNDFDMCNEFNFSGHQINFERLDPTTETSVGTWKVLRPATDVRNQSYVGTGNGALTAVTGATASAQGIAITATSSTTFTVSGHIYLDATGPVISADPYPNATVGVAYSHAGFGFTITAGATAFVVGDKFKFQVYPQDARNGQAMGVPMAAGGKFRWTYPQAPSPKRFTCLRVNYMHDAADTLVMSVPWDNASAVVTGSASKRGIAHKAFPEIARYRTADTSSAIASGYMRIFTAATSKAALEAGSGDQYFNDTTTKNIWLKLRGGYNHFGYDASTKPILFLTRSFEIYVTDTIS